MAEHVFPRTKEELDSLLAIAELADVPFLVVGKKDGMPSAASEDELEAALGLVETCGEEVPNYDKERCWN
jgi:hypothetical protein